MAKSKFETSFVPLSIYSNNNLIGFSVIGIEPETNLMWIMAFLIDKSYQGKGYGKKAMKKLILFIKKNYKVDSITIGHRLDNIAAGKLYSSLGYKIIEKKEKEVIRRLMLKD